MAIILLSEYAARNGRANHSAVQMARRGSFNTAEKKGRQWFIDEDEEYPDNRIKHGKYIGHFAKRKNKKKAAHMGNGAQPADNNE